MFFEAIQRGKEHCFDKVKVIVKGLLFSHPVQRRLLKEILQLRLFITLSVSLMPYSAAPVA